MTTSSETFEQLIRHRTTKELLPFLLTLDKKDVVPVRQKALSLKQELEKYIQQEVKPNHFESYCPMTPEQHEMLFLAGLATYSRKEALGRGFDIRWSLNWDSPTTPTAENSMALKVLEHTRPDWLAEWLTRRTRANLYAAPAYPVLRTLEARGLLTHEPWLVAQSVAHRLIRYNWRRNQVKSGDIEDYDQLILHDLRTDATLLARDLPLLFDYDTMVDSAATYSGKARTTVSWLTLLPQLVESGHLERADLLTRCLLALRRDFRRPLLTWFKNVFLGFNPTPAERLARQGELLELLAHPLPLVVNFALDQLKDLWAEPTFEPALLVQYADGLMSRQDLKTGIKTLLSGFSKFLKINPALAPALSQLYIAALPHADSAVQERAAKGMAELLLAKKPLLTPDEIADLTATIPTYADLLAPAARAVLTPWLAPAAVAAPPAETLASYSPRDDFAPDLSAATAVAPVADWHELLFLTGQVLQHDDPLALERWLDGLLRLRPQFPADYAELVQPYVVRIMPGVPGTAAELAAELIQHGPDGRANHLTLVQLFLLSWANGFAEPFVGRPAISDTYSVPDPLVMVAQQRLVFVEALLAAGLALPLLSTPTHAPYWVAPTTLVERLLAYQAAQQEPNPTDFALALARTAWHTPDAAATKLLPQLQLEDLRALLAWFLAPTAKPLPALPTPAAAPSALAEALPWLWAVAARTRQPTGHFPALASLTPGEYPNVAQPWQPEWELQPKSKSYVEEWKPGKPTVTEHWLDLLVQSDATLAPAPSDLLLYSLYGQLQNTGHPYQWRRLRALEANYPFLLALLAQYPAPLYWHTLALAATRDIVDSSNRDVLLQAMRGLLGDGPAFDAPTTLLLAIGLTYNASACRALALEALLAAIATARLVPAALGQTLGRLLTAGFVPVQRLTDGLAEIRASSPTADAALHQLLDALLPALPAEPPRNTRKLLDAYTDLISRTRQPVPGPVQARLREWQASASLKKASASLLAAH
jgi:hypothetical protein